MSDIIREEIIQKAHDGIWDECLLSAEFDYFRYYVLAPVERVCMEDLVNNIPLAEMCTIYKVNLATLKRRIRRIKEKLRVGASTRVDNFQQLRNRDQANTPKQHKYFLEKMSRKRSFRNERYSL